MGARAKRAFDGNGRERVLAQPLGGAGHLGEGCAQFSETQTGKVEAAFLGGPHRQRHGFVRVAEGQTFFHQIIGKVGGGGVSLRERREHVLGLDPNAADHVGVDRERVDHGVRRVEQWFLVFLIVLVVGQRLAFHEGEQRHEMAVDAPGLAAHEFGHVGVFLLRHDRGTGAEAVGEVDEADARTHPQNEFFRQSGQMRHQERARRAELDGKVAVAHGIQRVAADFIETQFSGNRLTVDRVAGSGQRCRTQRQAIQAAAAVLEALEVPAGHLEIGEQVVAERHRLRDLEVREAGHRRVGVRLCHVEQAVLKGNDEFEDVVDGFPQPQTDVGCHLIIAAAARVQALTRVAHERGQAFFDIEVDVLVIEIPLKRPARDFIRDLRHAAFDVGEVFPGENSLSGEHPGVGKRSPDVLRRHAAVEKNRGGVAFDQFRYGLVEASRPGFRGFKGRGVFDGHGGGVWYCVPCGRGFDEGLGEVYQVS